MMLDEKAALDHVALGPAVTESFAEHGVACLRGLVDAAGVDRLRELVELAIRNPDPARNPKPGRTYIVETGLWKRFRGFRDFAFDSGIAEAAALVMGSREARMYNDTMFVKEPSAPEPTPWHQDLPYFRLDGPRNCSAWIALDPANAASGAMTYVPGSHRWGKLYQPTSFVTGENQSSDGFDGTPPDVDADPDRYPTVGFEVEPGDVVFHHLLTLHKAGPNGSTGTRRRVHTIRFAGDGSTWLNRPFSTVEFETKLDDGAPLDGPDFPVLARR